MPYLLFLNEYLSILSVYLKSYIVNQKATGQIYIILTVQKKNCSSERIDIRIKNY